MRRTRTRCVARILVSRSVALAPSPRLTSVSPSHRVSQLFVLDKFTHDVIAPLVTVRDLREHGVTLHLKLEHDREEIPDVPSVYFVSPSAENIKKISSDFSKSLYEGYYLNFSSTLPESGLEALATAAVRANAVGQVKCVRDQYLGYISLEDDLFDLSLGDGYRLLHDPRVGEKEVERFVAAATMGLFSVCATLGQVPVIRAQKGGAAEMVAKELDSKIRESLAQRDNPFDTAARMHIVTSSVQRPLLCVFDRNFDLTAMLQHSWTYQPLVHDVLNMNLNRVDVKSDSPVDIAAGSKPKSYTLESSDPFWAANASAQFPKVAEQVEVELAKYKDAIKRVNAQTSMADDPDGFGDSTSLLANAVQSLPELQENKRVIDKHTNIATALLRCIKQRGLDEYYAIEEDLLVGKGDKASVMSLLQATGRGSAADKVRLAIVYTLSATEGMSPQDAEAVEGALRASGADTTALAYVKRMMHLNASLKKNMSGGAAATGNQRPASSQTNILDWADKLYGQSINTITKGVKNLLSGERVLPIAVAVDALMANQMTPETAAYAYLDPKAPRGKPATPREGEPAYQDGICFVVGGGNYIEYQSLLELPTRERSHVRSVVYGATSLVAGERFLDVLAHVGTPASS